MRLSLKETVCFPHATGKVILIMENATDNQEWEMLTYAEKNHQMFLREKELLDCFLAHGAISRTQHDKSLHDLKEKMGEKE